MTVARLTEYEAFLLRSGENRGDWKLALVNA
jgi:hypothetical protein